MRNLTAKDLGLELFCGAEPRRAGWHKNSDAVGLDAALSDAAAKSDHSPEMVTAPSHFEFNEEAIDDGPDPYQAMVDQELELERRGIEPFQGKEGGDDGDQG